MFTVKLSTPSPEWPLLRQTPNSKGVWGNYQFFADQDIAECDYWVVYENLLGTQKTLCPSGNTLLITAEPCSEHYPRKFLKQFGEIVSFHRDLGCPNVIYNQPALPWHVGRKVVKDKNIGWSKDYDELKLIKDFRKNKTISVITSNKSFLPGHLKRLEFVRKLEKQDRCDVDIFGRGIKDIEDKCDAIANYKYHIALENSRYPEYFTEKLTDAFLGGSYPFYYGCSNIENYFPEGSFTTIDIDNFEKSIDTIDNAINNNAYEESIDKIKIARELVLDKYNIFPTLVNIFESLPHQTNKNKETITIFPQLNYQSLLKSFAQKVMARAHLS